jgi:hypothetical protein
MLTFIITASDQELQYASNILQIHSITLQMVYIIFKSSFSSAIIAHPQYIRIFSLYFRTIWLIQPSEHGFKARNNHRIQSDAQESESDANYLHRIAR